MSDYIELTDDLCEPGKFMDTLSPETVQRAGYIDATKPAQHKRPAGPYTDPLRDLPPILGSVCAHMFAAQSFLKTHRDDKYAQYLASKCEQTLADIEAWTQAKWGQS